MSDEISLLEWGFKGLVGAALTVGWYLWTSLVKVVSKNKDDLAEYKTHVAENYIKKDVIERVHTRLDGLAEKEAVERLSEEMSEIRTDIKSILKMMGSNNGRAKTAD